MSILADSQIAALCLATEEDIKLRQLLDSYDIHKPKPMIHPFVNRQVRTRTIRKDRDSPETEEKIVSYGLGSFGYDLRSSDEFKIFTNINSTIVDPKNFDPRSFIDHKGEFCIIPPNSFILSSSMEYLVIPRNVSALVVGKSTYARVGISCLCTPLEAGWEGFVTLEFCNTTPLPAKFYANEGCCQVQFFQGDVPCDVSYADRNGKYMNQIAGPVVAKV